jgi:hypothetical protein
MVFDSRAWERVENAGFEVKRLFWAKVGVSRVPEEHEGVRTCEAI